MATTELPLVSVVTPCLNAGRYIEQCILSVQAQSYPKVEHVIVDGLSSDDTMSIIKKHEHEYNVRWISERDRNASEATNKGMRIASGDILAILPSDDLYLPWSIRTVVEKFRANASADVVYGDMIQLPFGRRYGAIYFNPPEEQLKLHLSFNSIGGMTVFFRNYVFNTLSGFDENLRIVSDYDFWLRVVERFRFSKVHEVLACFRYRDRSISVGNPGSHKLERRHLESKYTHLLAGKSVRDEISYYSRRTFLASGRLLRHFGRPSVSNSMQQSKNLINSRSISKPRLMREILFSPILSTNNPLQRLLTHGFVDINALIELNSVAAHKKLA